MEQEISPRYKVLYIDDEADNLVVFKSAFRRYYDVITALSAHEALDILRDEKISLIITDQRMPEMTGIDLIKSLPDEPYSIRMVLTGFSDVEAIIEAINSGSVYKYVTKPWDKNDLKVTIDKAIEALEFRNKNKMLLLELKEANEQLEKKVIERTLQIQLQKEEIESQKTLIESEKEKADSLLLNILPFEIAEELKTTGKAKACRLENVTVLFSDFVDFTKISENLVPEQVVDELDYCFQAFDDITEKYGLEKIKTIGDAYMCVGGIPVPDSMGAHNAVLAAIEMQSFLSGLKEANKGNHFLNARIGIHTGPVIAGVVGKKKFAYDIWGDTVNTAARMESNSEGGKINISETTYELIKDSFECAHRGKIEVKGKGEMNMYFAERQLNEFAENGVEQMYRPM